MPAPIRIQWTGYMKHRVTERELELDKLEEILRHSVERYYDTVTNRLVVVGRYDRKRVVLIPIEIEKSVITPITVHTTTRQQIKFRLKIRRLIHE